MQRKFILAIPTWRLKPEFEKCGLISMGGDVAYELAYKNTHS